MINRRGQSGMAIIQSIMALAILLIASFIFVGALQSMRSQVKGTLVTNSSEREVNEIIENLRSGIENYQVDFSASDSDLDQVLRPETLPMAWDIGIQTEAENCRQCQGRYGYVIQPFEGYRGLYLVTVRLTNKEWREPFKDYQFTVTTR